MTMESVGFSRIPAANRWFALALAIGGLGIESPSVARADTVAGRVDLPRQLATSRRFSGYWRVENGTVPVKDLPSGAVVVLEGAAGAAPEAKTYAVKINGYAPDKAILIVGPGSVVEITNEDRVPHDFSTPSDSNLMPIERLSPGKMRRQKFATAGIYEIRSAQHPATSITVVVAGNPHVAVVEAGGTFKFPADVAKGSVKLKVWAKGSYVHEETLDVSSSSKTLRIEVSAQADAAK
jgi:plastocyanin